MAYLREAETLRFEGCACVGRRAGKGTSRLFGGLYEELPVLSPDTFFKRQLTQLTEVVKMGLYFCVK